MARFHRVAGLAIAVVAMLPRAVGGPATEAHSLLAPLAILNLRVLRAVIADALFALIAVLSRRARMVIFRPRVLLASIAKLRSVDCSEGEKRRRPPVVMVIVIRARHVVMHIHTGKIEHASPLHQPTAVLDRDVH